MIDDDMLQMRWMEFHGLEHGLWRILNESRMWQMFEEQLMMA